MRDVPDQLRDYWAGITADLTAPTAEEAMTERIGAGDVRPVQDRPGRGGRPSARSWWQQPAVVATAAAGAALIVFGGGTWFGLSLGNRNDVANETTVPTTMAPTTIPTSTTTPTTASLPGIVSVPVPVGFTGASESLLAVSAREVWTVGSPMCHLKDGVWACYLLTGGWAVRGLAEAPDGTVWAATDSGVFSFDGAEWTRQFDAASDVAVDGVGTVWIGGRLEGDRYEELWLARWDGQSWVRVDRYPQAPLSLYDYDNTHLAVSPDGDVWIGGWYNFGVGTELMRYDGATMEAVPTWEVEGLRPGIWDLEAAPNGDLWVLSPDDAGELRVARYDGEAWVVYDWPYPDPIGLAVAPDGTVWAAADSGLCSFDGAEWTTRVEGHGHFAVDVAPDGTVWYTDAEGVHALSTP